jgi:BMFP domain-containing protein YqiC
MSTQRKCIKGATPKDGDLKIFFDLLRSKDEESVIEGLNGYEFDKVICPSIATLVIGEDTEQTLFHLLSKKWTASLIIKAVPDVNEIINKFVDFLYEIIVIDNNHDIIKKIKETKVLGQPFLDFKGRKINNWGSWKNEELSLTAKETANENERHEHNDDIKKRLSKMVNIISHMEGEKVETKSRASSNASTASINTVSSTESESGDNELIKLRKEFEELEKESKYYYNKPACNRTKKNINEYQQRIETLEKKCNSWYNSCTTDDKNDIKKLKEKIKTNKETILKLTCVSNGGKRKTAKKQQKTRKSKKSKRSTRKHK